MTQNGESNLAFQDLLDFIGSQGEPSPIPQTAYDAPAVVQDPTVQQATVQQQMSLPDTGQPQQQAAVQDVQPPQQQQVQEPDAGQVKPKLAFQDLVDRVEQQTGRPIPDAYERALEAGRTAKTEDERDSAYKRLIHLGLAQPDPNKGFWKQGVHSLALTGSQAIGNIGYSVGIDSLNEWAKEIAARHPDWQVNPDASTLTTGGDIVGSALGYTAPSVVATALAATNPVTAAGIVPTGVAFLTILGQEYGGNKQEYLAKGYSDEDAMAYAFLEAIPNAAIELLPWGATGKVLKALGGGKVVGKDAAGKVTRAIRKIMGKKVVTRGERHAVAKAVIDSYRKKFGSSWSKYLMRYGREILETAAGEAGEEALQYGWSNIVHNYSGQDEEFDLDQMLTNAAHGFIGGAALGLIPGLANARLRNQPGGARIRAQEEQARKLAREGKDMDAGFQPGRQEYEWERDTGAVPPPPAAPEQTSGDAAAESPAIDSEVQQTNAARAEELTESIMKQRKHRETLKAELHDLEAAIGNLTSSGTQLDGQQQENLKALKQGRENKKSALKSCENRLKKLQKGLDRLEKEQGRQNEKPSLQQRWMKRMDAVLEGVLRDAKPGEEGVTKDRIYWKKESDGKVEVSDNPNTVADYESRKSEEANEGAATETVDKDGVLHQKLHFSELPAKFGIIPRQVATGTSRLDLKENVLRKVLDYIWMLDEDTSGRVDGVDYEKTGDSIRVTTRLRKGGAIFGLELKDGKLRKIFDKTGKGETFRYDPNAKEEAYSNTIVDEARPAENTEDIPEGFILYHGDLLTTVGADGRTWHTEEREGIPVPIDNKAPDGLVLDEALMTALLRARKNEEDTTGTFEFNGKTYYCIFREAGETFFTDDKAKFDSTVEAINKREQARREKEGGKPDDYNAKVRKNLARHFKAVASARSEQLAKALKDGPRAIKSSANLVIYEPASTWSESMREIGKRLNVKVGFFSYPEEDGHADYDHNGITDSDGVLWLNVRTVAEEGPMGVLGHEWTHDLKRTSPELYRTLAETLLADENVKGIVAEQLQALAENYGKDAKSDYILEEFVADRIGDVFRDKGFWERYANRTVDKGGMRLLESLMKHIMKLIDAVRSVFSEAPESRSANTFLTNLEGIYDTVANVLDRRAEEYAKAPEFQDDVQQQQQEQQQPQAKERDESKPGNVTATAEAAPVQQAEGGEAQGKSGASAKLQAAGEVKVINVPQDQAAAGKSEEKRTIRPDTNALSNKEVRNGEGKPAAESKAPDTRAATPEDVNANIDEAAKSQAADANAAQETAPAGSLRNPIPEPAPQPAKAEPAKAVAVRAPAEESAAVKTVEAPKAEAKAEAKGETEAEDSEGTKAKPKKKASKKAQRSKEKEEAFRLEYETRGATEANKKKRKQAAKGEKSASKETADSKHIQQELNVRDEIRKEVAEAVEALEQVQSQERQEKTDKSANNAEANQGEQQSLPGEANGKAASETSNQDGPRASLRRKRANPIFDEKSAQEFDDEASIYATEGKTRIGAQTRADAKRRIRELGGFGAFADKLLNGQLPEDDTTIAGIQLMLNSPWYRNLDGLEKRKPLLRKYMEISSNKGRELRAFRRDLAEFNAEDADAFQYMLDTYLSRLDIPLSRYDEIRSKILGSFGIDIGHITEDQIKDRKRLDDAIVELATSTSSLADKLKEFHRNALLSGPGTHGKNIFSNAAHAAYLLVRRVMEAALNSLFGKFGHKVKDGATWGEFAYAWNNLKKYRKDLRKTLADIWNFEALNGISGGKLDINYLPAIPGKFGKVVRTSQKLLLSADAMFRSFAEPLEALAMAYRLGTAQGLEGEALDEFARKELSDPESESSKYGKKKADELLFVDKSPEGRFDTRGINLINSFKREHGLRGLVAHLIFPFLNTPHSILRKGIRYSPLGSANLIWQTVKHIKDKAPLNDSYMQILAEQAIALPALALVAGLTFTDDDDDDYPLLTGDYTERRGGRGAFERSNLPAHSIRIGNTWYDYSAIEPLSNVLSTIANMSNAFRNKDKKGFHGLFMKTGKMLLDKSYFAQFREVLEWTSADEYTIRHTAANFVSSWIPNVIKQPILYARDNVMEGKNAGFLDLVLTRSGIPMLAPKVDYFGRDVKRDSMEISGRTLWRLINPVTVRDANYGDEADMLLRNYNYRHQDSPYFPSIPARRIKDRRTGETLEMTPEQYHDYCKLRGELFHGAVLKGIRRRKLSVSNPSDRDIEIIKKLYAESGRIAGERLFKGKGR